MVYSPLQSAAKYFKYYVHAANSKGHGMHSPFVYEFITKVMNDFTPYEDYSKVETLRKRLLADTSEIFVEDIGQGVTNASSKSKTVASIVKNTAKPKKFGQLLYRMVKYYHSQTILELGTSLGITTSYLSFANPAAKIITIEGVEAIANVAQKHFSELHLQNIELVKGQFGQVLSTVLSQNPKTDFAFIDGSPQPEDIDHYFQQILPTVHNDTLLVFDGIHRSKEMENAWKKLIQHESVTCDIDLFYIGILSFRQEFREKQSFSVRN